MARHEAATEPAAADRVATASVPLGVGARRLRVWTAAILGLCVLLGSAKASETLSLRQLARKCRIVRYAATGDAAPITGNADTPANKAAWLDAMSLALVRASDFFYKPHRVSETYVEFGESKTRDVWEFDPIPLLVSTPSSEANIVAQLAKVTWVVKPLNNTPYSHANTVCFDGWIVQGLGSSRATALAQQIANVGGDHLYWEAPYQHYMPCTCSYYGVLGQLCRFCNYTDQDYAVVTAGAALRGYWQAPWSRTVVPAPAFEGASPPEAKVLLYWLDKLAATAVPRGQIPYDHLGLLGTTLTEAAPDGEMTCPNPPDRYVGVGRGWVNDGLCYMTIDEPDPDGCWLAMMTAASSASSSTANSKHAAGCASGSCSRAAYEVDQARHRVKVSKTPIWTNNAEGPGLSLGLHYVGGGGSAEGSFGHGWDWSPNLSVTSYGSGARIVHAGGSGPSWWFMDNGDGTWDDVQNSGLAFGPSGTGHVMTTEGGDSFLFDSQGRLSSISDDQGRTLSLTYGTNGRLAGMADSEGNTLTVTYNAQGFVSVITSSDGDSASFSYNEQGFLCQVVDMGGVATAYEYGRQTNDPMDHKAPITKIIDNANLAGSEKETCFAYSVSPVDGQDEIAITDPTGATTVYRRDSTLGTAAVVTAEGGVTTTQYAETGMGMVLTAQVDPLGNERSYEYDEADLLVAETDPAGNTMSYTYNDDGKLLTQILPGGATTSYTYTADGLDILTRTDPNGNVETYAYDADRNVTSVTRSMATGQDLTVSYTYDGSGRIATQTEPSGRTTTHAYASDGRVLSTSVTGSGTTSFTYDSRGLVGTITYPSGATVAFTNDDMGRATQETWSTDGTSTVRVYGCCGIDQTTDRSGRITNYEYDANGRLTATIDHFGNRTEREYDGDGRLTVIRDALGNETTTVYDSAGQVTSVTYPDGTSEAYQYDSLGRRTRHTDRGGRTSIWEYDARGNVVARRIEVPGDPDPVVHTLETLVYDLGDRITSRTNADSLTIAYAYDGLGRVISRTYPDGTASTITYGPAGVLTETSRLGHTTTYTYDAVGRVQTVTDPLGAVMSYTYTATGKRASITDALGRTTSFGYDAEGRKTTTTFPDGTSEAVAYAPNGLIASRTDASGAVASFAYDAMGRLAHSAINGNELNTRTYDALGHVATATDSLGVTRTFAYDSMGRRTRVTMPDGTFSQTTYGPDGALTETDRAGAVSSCTYGALGRVATVTNSANETTSYEHDLNGRMTALVDPKGNRTEWTYDTEGHLTAKEYADGSQLTYTYDADGKRLSRTDGNGSTTAYTYDAAGRHLTVDYPNDTDIVYTYDAAGRRSTVTDAAGMTVFSYKPQTDYVASVDGPFADDTVSMSWDAVGRRLGTAIDGSSVVAYGYDGMSRLATAAGASGVFAYAYVANSGVMASISHSSGVATTRTFDTLGRLTSVNHSRPGQAPAATISGFGYTLDGHDRRTRVDLALGGRWDYTYDAAGQLVGGVRTGPTVGGGNGTLATYGYQYDAMGNPVQSSEDAGVSTRTYNDMNQLVTGDWTGTLSAFGWTQTEGLAALTVADGTQTVSATVLDPGEWTAKSLAASPGANAYAVVRTANDATTTTAQASVTRPADQTVYTHDDNGNMLTNGAWTYTWNDENRLSSATRADGLKRLEFSYDYRGRRRTKDTYSRATTNDAFAIEKSVSFVYDGWLLLEERTTDHPAGPGTETTRTYLHGLDVQGALGGEGVPDDSTAGGIGSMLSVTTTRSGTMAQPSSVLFLYDGGGNVSNLVDPTTTASVAAYEYSPFGKVLVAHGPLAQANPIQFSAKYHDADTGLLYYGYRYYCPALARWLSRDPLEEAGGIALYAFAANAPSIAGDALGLACHSWSMSKDTKWFEDKLKALTDAPPLSWFSKHGYKSGDDKGWGFKFAINASFKRCSMCCADGTLGKKTTVAASVNLAGNTELLLVGGKIPLPKRLTDLLPVNLAIGGYLTLGAEVSVGGEFSWNTCAPGGEGQVCGTGALTIGLVAKFEVKLFAIEASASAGVEGKGEVKACLEFSGETVKATIQACISVSASIKAEAKIKIGGIDWSYTYSKTWESIPLCTPKGEFVIGHL